MKRNHVFILLSILLLGGIYFFLRFSFGLFTPFNAWTASRDIANGYIQIVDIGEMAINFEKRQVLASSYGFGFYPYGCNASSDVINGTAYYNQKMIEHLEGKFGEGWWTKFQKQLDSLESSPSGSGWNYEERSRDFIDTLLLDICSTKDIEFVDLYPVLDSISSDEYEDLVLVEALKRNGFSVTKWGRGNWMEGPRIVSFTMSNPHCDCQVDKLYYSTEQKGKFKATERIRCKIANQ